MDFLQVQSKVKDGCFASQLKTGFSLLRLSKGEIFKPESFAHFSVIYLYDGSATVLCDEGQYHLQGGQLFLSPCDQSYSILADEDTEINLLYVIKVLAECDYFTLSHPDGSYAEQTTRYIDGHVCACGELVRTYYRQVHTIIDIGVECVRLYQNKEAELFMLLRATMSNEDFNRLLQPFSKPRIGFRSKVLLLAEKFNTVATLAEKVGMDRSYFQRLFKSEFGVSPSDWLQQRRAHRVKEYLRINDVPLKVAADDLEFSSIAALSTFCRKTYQKTAHEIQEESKLE
jgi:AraC-like DNA-binding protein